MFLKLERSLRTRATVVTPTAVSGRHQRDEVAKVVFELVALRKALRRVQRDKCGPEHSTTGLAKLLVIVVLCTV